MENRYRKYIFDASTLICLFAKEPGLDQVKKYLPNAIMSSVNAAEVYKHCLDKQELDIESAERLMQISGVEIIDFANNDAKESALLYKHTKQYGLSFADRACVALALSSGYPIVTCDKIWSKLDLDIKVIQVR